jgi:hypothetical protein
MPEKRGGKGVVPGGNAREMDARDRRRAAMKAEKRFERKERCPIEATSGHAFDDEDV